MWDELYFFFAYMMMAIMLRVCCEMGRKRSPAVEQGTHPPAAGSTLQQREWAEKAVMRYAEAQEKKWRNWNDAMFEPRHLTSN